MLPDLALLLALLLGFHWIDEADGRAIPNLLESLGGTAAATLVAIALARLASDRTARRMEEDGAEAALAGSRAPMLYPLFAWLAAGFAFRWDEFVAGTIPKAWFVLPEIVFFLPLALTTVAAWIAVDRSEASILSRVPSVRRALSAGLRRNALVLVPVGVVLVVHRTFVSLDAAGVPGVGRFLAAFRAYPDLVYAALALGVLVFLVIAPAIVRRALGAVPLPAGETRVAVDALLDRLGVRRRDVLLWPTEGRVQNAMTIGLVGATRYIIVSDGLLAVYPLPELLAVVAHEAGHVRHRHLLLHGVALVSLLLVFLAAGALLSPWLPPTTETALAVLVLWFGWFGLVGKLSRRFEREADVFAAEHAADAGPAAPPEDAAAPLPPAVSHTFFALKRAQRQGGGMLRHGSATVRMAYVMAWASSASFRADEARTRKRVRLALAGFALAAVGLTAARMPGTLERGHALMTFDEAIAVSREGDAARRRGDAVAARAAGARAYDLFRRVVAQADARDLDREMRRLAAVAEYDAADRAIRGLGDAATARAGFEKTLSRCGPLEEAEVASSLRHAALVDLGRLALARTDDPAAGLDEAKRRLTAASALPSSDRDARYRQARTRLLEAAIALRSADAAEADRARRDLAVQAAGTESDEPEWLELAEDAKAELARVPPR